MPSNRLGLYGDPIHLEDADYSKIKEGLEALAASGLSAGTLEDIRSSIVVHECAGCAKKYAASDPLHYLPRWCKQNTGRGRKTELEAVNKALGEWNNGQGSMCEPCIIAKAESFAESLLTLDNKSLKRFFHVYGAQIDEMKREKGKGFFDWYGHRFHVKFITHVFASLPQRKKTAFKAMTSVMKELELL